MEGWVFFKYGGSDTNKIHGHTNEEMVNCLNCTDYIADLIGQMCESALSDKAIVEFIDQKDLYNSIWFVFLDPKNIIYT